MQINLQKNSLNKNNFKRPSFSGTRLFSVRLKDLSSGKAGKTIEAFITKLDRTDRPRLVADYDRWRDTSYGRFIIDDCIYKNSYPNDKNVFIGDVYLSLETPALEKNPIKGFAEIKTKSKAGALKLEFLQSATEIADEAHFKGVGECLMYAVSKIAQALKRDEFFLKSQSVSENFYKRLGLKSHATGSYPVKCTLTSDKFEPLQKGLAEKYDIKQLVDDIGLVVY